MLELFVLHILGKLKYGYAIVYPLPEGVGQVVHQDHLGDITVGYEANILNVTTCHRAQAVVTG